MHQQRSKVSESLKAVHFLQHYPSNFLRPYGEADESTSEEKVMRRILPLNCEWLVRPKVAASEFAQTLTDNLHLLATTECEQIRSSQFAKVQESLSPFIASLNKLNKEEGEASAAAVKEFSKMMLTDDDDMDEFFSSAFKLGGALYLLGCHYKVVNTLMSNPQWLADKTVGTTHAVKFILVK
jgi:hypothetical protein